MKHRKSLTWVLAGLAALTLASCGGQGSSPAASSAAASPAASPTNVGIIQLVEHPALDLANKGIVDALADRGYRDGEKIKIDRQNAQADQSNMKNIAQRFVSNKCGIIFAIATPAAQTVANTTKTIPIVGTAITDYESAKLVKNRDKPGTNVTGTSDMNPVAEQAGLIKQLVPGVKTVGVIYNSSEVNSEVQVKAFRAEAGKLGMQLKVATVSNVNDIQQAAHSLVGKVQALYIPTDNVLASAMPTLVKVTNPAKLPVIAGEPGMVRSGALATIGIDYYTLGRMTGDMGADILEGKAKPETTAIRYQKDFKVTLNEKAAAEIGCKFPESVRANAEIIK
ncbi:ABC transporter substrate-binding protein [Mesosutterella sp. AGMB02718]|uniref:ABC transporter substrate-binding protein n=1 Tax=Mesosutterella faecium TaxID=2925194 RepID=A0ABT7IJB4_9BURK|nr:ABC transporter substrate-binding protein [Mesosutterella sp. AGMB02718]MDL2058465.1 ABC transporter substrate-binding protein [Mesosutterella sp. AGMB02718]